MQDVQLRFKKSLQFCFVSGLASKKRGFQIELQFSRWDAENQDSIEEKKQILSLAEFAQRWPVMQAEGWKIEIV